MLHRSATTFLASWSVPFSLSWDAPAFPKIKGFRVPVVTHSRNIRVISGLYWDYTRRMENEMETTGPFQISQNVGHHKHPARRTITDTRQRPGKEEKKKYPGLCQDSATNLD